MKKTKASFTCQSIYDIDPQFFVSLGVKAVIADLDQTLDTAFTDTPSPRVFALRDELAQLHIQLIVISNNRDKRVSPYVKKLQVPYLSFALKFFKGKVLKFLKKENLKVEDCVFVGDQLYTDGIYTSKIHGRLILTEPLSPKDNIPTKMVRGLDKHFREKYRRQGRLGLPCPLRIGKGE
ncbi:MAG: hypothetical protein WCR56_03380 [Bacilli bacterium]|jgi:HAD superfamily phosphatase (TIGR01668 family)